MDMEEETEEEDYSSLRERFFDAEDEEEEDALRFSALFSASRFSSLRKYSPLSSCRSTLLGIGAGGKGVYCFFSFTTLGVLRLLMFFLPKDGRKRVQSSWARAGS